MNSAPLADKLRPSEIKDLVGQEHLTDENGLIHRIFSSGRPISLLLWGPPGCGKTTLARLYAKTLNCELYSFTPLFHGVADLKKHIAEKKAQPLLRRSILFVDEIHRFNKAQQDLFLPYLEDGTITLVAATTENPSFVLNNALLSRLQVVELKPLKENALAQILSKIPLSLTPDARAALLNCAGGDARHLLNMVENIQTYGSKNEINLTELQHLTQKRAPLYDRASDYHHNLISALHKSIRGSDPDAALYYLSRMLIAGEDPRYILRRLARMALEDIGLTDPQAAAQATSCWDIYEKLGKKEGELAIAQLTAYLALAPKSNRIYLALDRAKELAKESSHLKPPAHILSKPSEDYIYDHDTPQGCSGQNYFPEDLPRQKFYDPVERGFEREMKKRSEYFGKMRKDRT